MSQQSSLTQSAHSVRQVLTAYTHETPSTVHAICAAGCALARRWVYGLAQTSVEIRDAISAMMSDLLIVALDEANLTQSLANFTGLG